MAKLIFDEKSEVNIIRKTGIYKVETKMTKKILTLSAQEANQWSKLLKEQAYSRR